VFEGVFEGVVLIVGDGVLLTEAGGVFDGVFEGVLDGVGVCVGVTDIVGVGDGVLESVGVGGFEDVEGRGVE